MAAASRCQALQGRLADPEEQSRLKEELALMTFGE
jgi:hypothetical protein